ncbi:ribosome biogenesis GTPase Der [Pikeienuella piscinae]|uniref:GTPase Der n=1 Tax=Pikeienuella piscinae TaxID=2748098 RepID=A0A7L5BXB7_9RHOB|nr:ribosome biogenesis GTPase Der [Pikeienuella piscinae]QIE54534.1 ribosome biogenesis GTPase Der [Pikeienuella piscinae]
MAYTIALIGRPNVGKSTLFNRLVGRRIALVDDQPGVTRDLREGDGRIGDLNFRVIDTAGLEIAADQSLPGRMRKLTERAVEMADCCLFMTDARAGVTPADREVADILRRAGADVLLICNKAEGRVADATHEAWSLGIGEPIPVSAEHGEGIQEIYAALQPRIDEFEAALEAIEAPDEADEDRPLQIAVVGRPNAGKSTLVNAVLGEDRLLVGPEAGITRDAIGLETDWGGRAFRIFDTAGLRKRARIDEKLEKLSASDAVRAVKFAEVVVLLMDAASAFETQDLRIADLAEREGRAVVFAINKWDLEEARGARLAELKEMQERLLPQLSGAPLVTVSALTGRGLDRLRGAVLDMHAVWNKRVTTAKLNQWLGARVEAHPPPAPSGRRIRLRYMTQIKARPPSFIVSCSKPEDLPASYSRFLVNGLRQDFGLKGVPIRLSMRKGENPYADKKKPRGHRA